VRYLSLAAIWLTATPSALPQSISVDRMRADLQFLSSDALEGRLSLHRGSEVAIQWIASEFAKAGLKPAAGNSFLQEFGLIEFRNDRNESCVMIGSRREPATSLFPNSIKVRAPVVFAGYGITAPEFHYDDYTGLDARGKIALVFEHEPQEDDPRSVFNGTGNTRHASAHVKILNAQRHGAVAVLLASEPNRKHLTNAERSARIPGSQDRSRRVASQAIDDGELKIPLVSISDAAAADLLRASGRTPSELQSSIDRDLKPQSMPLSGAPAEIRLVIAERRRAITANLVGVLEGSDPELKKETIVFSAHYDHDGASETAVFHGADDNGSGTVGVVELARAFAASAVRPKRSLLFAIFAAEERGLLGSYYYAAHPVRPLDTTRAVINFDMIGRNETPSLQTEGLMQIDQDTTNELNLIGTINSPDYREIVEAANRRVGLLLNYKWDRDAALNIFQRSDQFPLSLHDIPAVWWFTGFHPDYHQASDTVEKINFGKMEKIVRLAYLTGQALADSKSVPQFVAAH
jgi:hypothetical protein